MMYEEESNNLFGSNQAKRKDTKDKPSGNGKEREMINKYPKAKLKITDKLEYNEKFSSIHKQRMRNKS